MKCLILNSKMIACWNPNWLELISTVIFYITVERNDVAALQNKYPVIIFYFSY